LRTWSGKTNPEIKALITAASEIWWRRLPVEDARNGELFPWRLENGPRLAHQMTVMTIGLY
jgi:hypothetical protein